jgi:hypothetical protein
MARTATALLLAVVALAACGKGGGDPTGDAVRTTLAGFAKATATRDYQSLCDRYLAPELVDAIEQAGLPCEAAIRPEFSATERPTLVVRSVAVTGDTARAAVHTDAANQDPADATIALVRVHGAWRIASLVEAGPQPAAP